MRQSESGDSSVASRSLSNLSGSLARHFDYRSGRVIALGRITLAIVFFVALWVDPSQPVRSSAYGYGLLLGYLLLAAALVLVAFRSWWWDYRLAWPTFVVDVGVFLAAVYFTEGAADEFTSPFLAFFAFLMLAATIRWDWRVTAVAGLVTTGLYLAVGLIMEASGIEFDLYRFGRRVIYMLILSLVLVWFGLQRRDRHVDRFVEGPGPGGDMARLLEASLDYAMIQSGARAGVIAWAEDEEPWAHLRARGLSPAGARVGPEEFDPSGEDQSVRLFDQPKQRQLRARGGARPIAVRGSCHEPLADMHHIQEGLALPLAGLTGRGQMVLAGIEGVTTDHVQIGVLLAREVGMAFDRHATLRLTRESAVARTRDALARDLHDTVAQSLAGASLRLEGLRAWIRGGGDPETEITAIKSALRDEQAHVRRLIERLRDPASLDRQANASSTLVETMDILAAQWDVGIRLENQHERMDIPATLAHEMDQLLREAVANAVRHGKATQVVISLSSNSSELQMRIVDNGSGFPDGSPARPRSIAERVSALGGTLDVETGPAGSTLEISVPAQLR